MRQELRELSVNHHTPFNMSPCSLPTPKSTQSFWRSNLHPIDDHRSTPELPSEVDIAIIGAGYAGATTAHHILDICKEKNVAVPKIVILEARHACSGATGRNGGHLKPDPFNRPAAIAETYGIEAAEEVANFEVSHVPAVKKLIEDEDIDCDFVLTRCIDVSFTQANFDRMKAGVEMLRKNNVTAMKDMYVAAGAEAEQLSGVKGAKGCFTYTTGHLYPYKLMTHLLAKATKAGINLQTHTPVSSVASTPDSQGYFTITTTERGTVRAKKIVYATNGYTSHILPEFAGKIIPTRGICSHIVPEKKPAPHLPNSYILRAGAVEYEYLIPRLDGSIVVGGGRSRYYHNLDSWYDTVKDDELIENAKPHFEGYMQRIFHGWENSGAKLAKIWTGIMGYSSDGLPHIGAVPGRKNQFMLAGFNGHGMPQVFLSAKGVAAMVMNGADFESTGVPRVFKASQARLDNTKNVVLDTWEASKKGPVAKL